MLLNFIEENIIEILILINILILVHIYIFYPITLMFFAKIFKRPLNIDENFEPTVTILIAAYNEEKFIKDAIESIFNSEYPKEKIIVLVGSDGSNDKTNDILTELSKKYQNLEYFAFQRLGKNKVLNELMRNVNTQIVFFMDADIRLNPKSLRNLVEIMSDNSVGACISSMVILENNQNTGKHGETKYQNYEKSMRLNESKIASTVNSLGAFYGIKLSTYCEIPNEFVCDDLFPLYQSIIKDKRVIFTIDEPVFEIRSKTLADEFSRRIRLAAGGLATVKECKQILSPKYGWASYFVWNHKVLRWFTPLFLIILIVLTFLLETNSWLFLPVVILQLTLYIGAFLGWLFEKVKINFLPFKILLFIVSMNIGFLLGIVKFIRKEQNALWERIDT